MTTKIMNLFSNEKMLLEHSVLSYKFDLYFPEHKLSMKVDEKDTLTEMCIITLKDKQQ